MWRDLERLCAALQFPFVSRRSFPAAACLQLASLLRVKIPTGCRSSCAESMRPISPKTGILQNRAVLLDA